MQKILRVFWMLGAKFILFPTLVEIVVYGFEGLLTVIAQTVTVLRAEIDDMKKYDVNFWSHSDSNIHVIMSECLDVLCEVSIEHIAKTGVDYFRKCTESGDKAETGEGTNAL